MIENFTYSTPLSAMAKSTIITDLHGLLFEGIDAYGYFIPNFLILGGIIIYILYELIDTVNKYRT